MKKLNTVYELMEVIEAYHIDRCNNYEIILKHEPEIMTKLVVQKLLELEKNSLEIIGAEKSKMNSEKSPFLMSGPTLNIDPKKASDCSHDTPHSVKDALDCVFKSDQTMDDMLDRLEHSTSSSSIIELAVTLREINENKSREISNYTRMD